MNFKRTQSFVLIAVIILAVFGSVFFFYRNSNDKIAVETSDKNSAQDEKGDKEAGAVPSDESGDKTQPDTVFVHVAGQVKNTGVYELKNGLRVIDAVNMAGGPLQDADLDSLNLAEKLHDEEKIYVPKVGEVLPASGAVGGQSGPQDAGMVNINTAGAEELKSLPGIGDVLAGNIINYRNANGPFKSIDDIVNVPKIGPKTFENIKDKLTI